MPNRDWQTAGALIDTLLAASAAGGAAARDRAEELVRLVADLYGAGLERLLDVLHEHGALTDDVLDAVVADGLVSSLLLVHGLHPYDAATRIERALAGVRPYLGSHGGDVELLEVTADGVVRLRMLGSCDGCPSSAVTLKLAVETAIESAAPEITAIEVDEPAARSAAAALIPVPALYARLADGTGEPAGAGAARGGAPNGSAPNGSAPNGGAAHGGAAHGGAAHGGAAHGGATWVAVSELAVLASGAVVHVPDAPVPMLGCRIGADRYAFRDGCARCGRSLAGSVLARRAAGAAGDVVLRCPSCRAHYDVRRAGACLDDTALHLSPLPLLTDGDAVLVAVPAPVPT